MRVKVLIPDLLKPDGGLYKIGATIELEDRAAEKHIAIGNVKKVAPRKKRADKAKEE